MWAVVCFSMDNTVAAVPQFWVQRGICAWPKKSAQMFVECNANPNQSQFGFFKCKLLHSNIDSLEEARSLSLVSSGSSPNFVIDLFKEKQSSISQEIKLILIPSPPAQNLEANEYTESDQSEE